MIVVPIPVHGRLPLLKLTIERLYNKNGAGKVICVGDEPEAKELCESLGAEWVEHSNDSLGSKWNAGFMACQKYNPSGVLFAGSSDWVSDGYLTYCEAMLKEHDFIGKLGCYFVDVKEAIRAVWWAGYSERRLGEPIGIGRVLSAKLLDRFEWKPFEDGINNSLDFSMWQKVHKSDRFISTDHNQQLISISTDKWVNKHKFEDHWSGKIPSNILNSADKLIDSFPELKLL